MRTFRLLAVLGGLGLIGWGLYGLLHDHYVQDPLDVLTWAVGALVLHDGLWVPLVCLAGARFARGPVLRAWLIVASALTAVALPAVLRAGTDHGNPTLLPLPYLRNFLVLLGVSAAVGALWALALRWRRRRGRPD
ncbi:hypothetical protein GCM10009760_62770 [Kitasatospora kazusensis]|uniref:Uncharacterized protein n=1 Tax=Kitasatospora kazusensis TaxID=407974 RepID=A0ABP4KBG0_9ACTN